jgi:hypothetical protein
MEPARPLRDVFADLAEADLAAGNGADEVLRANGHPELPEPLVAEAVVSYADTAPHEVAEHLAPFVRANSSVPLPATQATPDPDWFGLLTTAPRVTDLTAGPDGLDDLPMPVPQSTTPDAAGGLDLDFGQGDTADHGQVEIPDEEPYTVPTEGPRLGDVEPAPLELHARDADAQLGSDSNDWDAD